MVVVPQIIRYGNWKPGGLAFPGVMNLASPGPGAGAWSLLNGLASPEKQADHQQPYEDRG